MGSLGFITKGAGGENMFFDAYGGGMAVTEALKRGWVFVSPHPTPNAAADCLQWLRQRRGLNVGHLYVMGHGSGGALALGSGGLTPRPSAVALFAPAATSIPPALGSVPIYMAVGKQDELRGASVRALATGLSGRLDCQFEEFDPCEHVMIVADALPSAFRFFDRH